MTDTLLTIANGAAAPLPHVPILPVNAFRETVLDLVNRRQRRVSAFFALPAVAAVYAIAAFWSKRHPKTPA